MLSKENKKDGETGISTKLSSPDPKPLASNPPKPNPNQVPISSKTKGASG